MSPLRINFQARICFCTGRIITASSSGAGRGKVIDEEAVDVHDSGTAIPYDEEDPFIRAEYEETLKRKGVTSRMAGNLFRWE